VTIATIWGAFALLISLGSLAFLGSRLAPADSAGPERALCIVTAVAAAMTIETLVLGRVGLGGSAPALAGISVLIGVAGFLLPARASDLGRVLKTGWTEAPVSVRALAGTATGLICAWAAFALLEPSFDLDSTFYTLPELARWINTGHPGSVDLIVNQYPIGNYPSTNEILMTWIGATSSNIGFLLLWPVFTAALLIAATVRTLRTLGCTWPIAALAGLTLSLIPIVAEAVTSLKSDLPSTAWLAVGVALCARVTVGKARASLLPFAIVALAMAVGMKTTVAPIGLAALVIAFSSTSRHRGAGSSGPRLATAGVAVAVVIGIITGGVWYLRNFVDHGSPLWPFVSLPGGDPLPTTLDYLSAPFIGSPLDTLDGRIGAYLHVLGPVPLLVAAALLVGALARDRLIGLGSVAVGVSAFLWSLAPATGEPPGPDGEIFGVEGARYLMPTALLAIGVIAVAASGRGVSALIARGALIASAIWGLVLLCIGRDGFPPIWVLAGAAALGAGVTVALSSTRAGHGRLFAAGALAAAAACVLLAVYPGGFVDRYADQAARVETPGQDSSVSYGGLARWFQSQPAYRDGEGPLVFSGVPAGPLTGGSFAHETEVIALGASCAAIASQAAGGWVIAPVVLAGAEPDPVNACFPPSSGTVLDDPPVRIYVVPDGGGRAA
jgi:hypothetical protein